MTQPFSGFFRARITARETPEKFSAAAKNGSAIGCAVMLLFLGAIFAAIVMLLFKK